MGITDTPPAHVPTWVVPASAAFLAIGTLGWDAAYILMARRSAATKSYSMPLLALAVNVSWEIIYALYISTHWLEQLVFVAWLCLDMPIVYTTLRAARYEWAHAPLVQRNFSLILGAMFAAGCYGNWAFASWWLAVPGRGSGDKTGKWWHGTEGIDCTELAYWTAGVAQLVLSPGSIAMLLVRGHSGGASHGIWASRFIGTIMGWIAPSALLWWYWPEAHGFFVHPFSVFLAVTCTACDVVYPFILAHVRRTERRLPDGRLVAGDLTKKQT